MRVRARTRARLEADAAEIIGRYPQARSALLPLLHLVQAEEGYVSEDGIEFCAEQLGLTEAEVTAVASFYTMYKHQPVGRVPRRRLHQHPLRDHGRRRHPRRPAGAPRRRQRRADRRRQGRLEHLECNAACDYAPVVMVNWEFFDNMTPQSARDLVDGLRSGADDRADPRRAAAVHLAAGGQDPGRASPTARRPTATPRVRHLAGLRIAKEHGWDARDRGEQRAGSPGEARPAVTDYR